MANDFYTSTSVPGTGAALSSATIRAEFSAISAGCDKLPGLSGNGNKAVVVNAGGTALTVTAAALALAVAFTTAGAGGITLTSTGATNVTLPTTGTLATLAGAETFTNKTITTFGGALTFTPAGASATFSPTGAGTVTIAPATAGTVNNVVIGGVTPLAGTFTTLGASSLSLTGTPLGPASGGTGVANNAASTLTISGSFATTFTVSGVTGVTLPTSGTLATLAGSEALTNKTYNGNTFTAGTGVLTIAAGKTATHNATTTFAGTDGKTLTISNSLTLAGTDATVMTFPTTSATIARTDAANTFTGVQTMTSPAITTPAFTGAFSGTYSLGGTPTINVAAAVGGAWTAAATWTLPALTLGGTVSGGGQQINNVVIGTVTPLAGAFTTLSASGNVTVTNGQLITAAASSALFNTVATTLAIGGAATTLTLGAVASATTWTGQAWTLTGANSTNNTALTVQNTSNAAAASHSYINVAVGGTTSTGDPHVRLTIPGGTSWYMGTDNSASDAFIIGTGTAVGTNPALTISAVLAATFAGAVSVSSGNLTTNVATTQVIFSASGVATGGAGFTFNTTGDILTVGAINVAGTTAPTSGWYLPSADLIRTPNSVTIDDNLTVTGGTITTGSGQDANILIGTTDGSDNRLLTLCAGGASSSGRGASLILYGNEHAQTGILRLGAGDVSGGTIDLYANAALQARILRVSSTTRWIEIFGSNGSSPTIQASDGDLTLTSAAATGSIILSPTGSGGIVRVTGGSNDLYVDDSIFAGLGGTGSNSPVIVLDGGTAANSGPMLRLRKNSLDRVLLGMESAILGGGSASNNMLFWVESTNDLKVYINGTERFKIASTADASRIVNGIRIGADSTNNLLDDATNGAGSATLFIGNASINVTSDIRMKPNRSPTKRDAWRIIDQIEVIDHDWKQDSVYGYMNERGPFMGVAAQQIQPITPWAVNKPGNPDDLWFVEHVHLVPLLIKDAQETHARLAALEARLN